MVSDRLPRIGIIVVIGPVQGYLWCVGYEALYCGLRVDGCAIEERFNAVTIGSTLCPCRKYLFYLTVGLSCN
jgi:hypothetical protein